MIRLDVFAESIKKLWFLIVFFRKACNLHMKRDLRDTVGATRREPARTHMDPLNTTRTLIEIK